jgi:hypothetical protein
MVNQAKNYRLRESRRRPPRADFRLCQLATCFWRQFEANTLEDRELKTKGGKFWRKMTFCFGDHRK